MAEVKLEATAQLSVTKEELRFLRDTLQNPLTEDESADVQKLRRDLFFNFTAALKRWENCNG